MCKHNEGISVTYVINGTVMNFRGGEFNGCGKEIHRGLEVTADVEQPDHLIDFIFPGISFGWG